MERLPTGRQEANISHMSELILDIFRIFLAKNVKDTPARLIFSGRDPTFKLR